MSQKARSAEPCSWAGSTTTCSRWGAAFYPDLTSDLAAPAARRFGNEQAPLGTINAHAQPTPLELPPALRRALRFVPAAVLSALVLPALVYPGGELFLSLENDRLVAGLIALVVAWWSRSILLTLLVGMVALWVLQLV